MNQVIEDEMEILWSDFEDYDVDQKLEAFERLKASVTEGDLPRLVELLKSERNDFWVRELLSDPISDLGGTKYLLELFDALELNEREGHDNDGFNHCLTEIAWSDPKGCKKELASLLAQPNFRHREVAEWLLTFCE
ncbi:hypothetical protein [Shewanella sp. BJSY2023SW005]|uniref:hypothetical protein n=1 Tax=Shewanella TaxID=22 RepID=UPI0039B5ABFD